MFVIKNYFIIYLLFYLINLLIMEGYTQNTSRRRTSNKCKISNDCPNNAFCDHNNAPTEYGQCVCHEGFIIAEENKTKECFQVGKYLGDSCQFDDQCMITFSTESHCFQNSCQCRDGAHYVRRENACYKSVLIGDFCRLTNNCVGDGTICRSGICHCPLETHPNENYDKCLPDVHLGEQCMSDSECVIENSRCHDVCRCKVSHIINKDENKCLKVASELSDDCEEDTQCTINIPYSKCDLETSNGTCTCRNGYHHYNYQCWVTVELRGICESDENCAHNFGAACIQDRCDCEEGFTIIDNQCSNCFKIKFNYLLLLILLIFYFKIN